MNDYRWRTIPDNPEAAMMTTPEELGEALREVFPSLAPRQKQAAQFILDNTAEIAFLSAGQVARRASVHAATVVRLAQRLGFEGYPGMQAVLRHQLSQYPAFLEKIDRTTSGSSTATILTQSFTQGRRNLEQAARNVDEQTFAVIADALLACRRVLVVGLGVARPVAAYLASSLRITGLDVHTADDTVSLAQEIALLDERDMLFAVDFHRYYRETVQAMESAREVKATRCALTDSPVSALVTHADHAISVPSEAAAPRTSLAPAMVLVEALLATITVQDRERAETALDRIDQQYKRSKVFT